MNRLVIALAIALAGCSHTPVVRDRPVSVSIPVPQPCVTSRPAEPARIDDGEWAEMDVRQKAARVGERALAWMTYGQQLYASTGACP